MHAAAHPARVVGDHAADAGDVGAGRVGPEPAAVAGEQAVDVAEHDARAATRTPRPVVLDPARRSGGGTSTRIASVWAWPLRLVPPARKVTRRAESAGAAPAAPPRRSMSRGIDHRPGDQPVGAGVGGVADQVERRA